MFKIIEVMCFDLNLIEMKLVIECLVRGRYNVELLELLVWLFLVKYLMIDFVFVRFELECVIFIILGVNKVV